MPEAKRPVQPKPPEGIFELRNARRHPFDGVQCAAHRQPMESQCGGQCRVSHPGDEPPSLRAARFQIKSPSVHRGSMANGPTGITDRLQSRPDGELRPVAGDADREQRAADSRRGDRVPRASEPAPQAARLAHPDVRRHPRARPQLAGRADTADLPQRGRPARDRHHRAVRLLTIGRIPE